MDPCVICHEPLWTDEIGFTVSCGHAFHRNCFATWNATGRTKSNARSSPSGIDCKCPICNQRVTDFIHVFLNFPKYLEDGEESDDETVSEDESDLLIDNDCCRCNRPNEVGNEERMNRPILHIDDFSEEEKNEGETDDYLASFDYLSQVQRPNNHIPPMPTEPLIIHPISNSLANIHSGNINQIPEQARTNNESSDPNICQHCHKPKLSCSQIKPKIKKEKKLQSIDHPDDKLMKLKYKTKKIKSILKETEKMNYENHKTITELKDKVSANEQQIQEQEKVNIQMKSRYIKMTKHYHEMLKHNATLERELTSANEDLRKANRTIHSIQENKLVETNKISRSYREVNEKNEDLIVELKKARQRIKELEACSSSRSNSKKDEKRSSNKKINRVVKELNSTLKSAQNLGKRPHDNNLLLPSKSKPVQTKSSAEDAIEWVTNLKVSKQSISSKKARKNIDQKKIAIDTLRSIIPTIKTNKSSERDPNRTASSHPKRYFNL